MQKVLDILEQYVEWLALAIGCLFLLLMVFIYVIGTPVSTTLGSRPVVTPANIEGVISDDAREPLEQAMSQPGVPTANVQSFATEFQEHMKNVGSAPKSASPIVWVTSAGAPMTPLSHADDPAEPTKAQNLAAIPQPLPVPMWYGVSTGKTNVQTAAGAPGAVVAPPAPMGFDAYGNPTGGIRQPVPPGGKDEIWATVAYTISAGDLADAFTKAKVPANLSTVFLRLDAVRQELVEDGSWGNDTDIQPLAYHQVPPFPKVTAFDQREYTDWASKNAITLLAPSFYPRLAGDTWYAPGQPDPNKVTAVRPVVDPAPVPGTPRGSRQRGPVPTAPDPTGTRRGSRPTYAPDDAQRPAVPFMQNMSPTLMEARQRAEAEARMRMGADAYRGGYGPPQGQYGPPQGQYGPPQGPYGMQPGSYSPSGVGQAQSVPAGYSVPSGSINPAEQADGDIFVWFHDDTVEPGKTYRYKLSYRIRNPLFGVDRAAESADASKVFAIASPPSEWSEPVVIDPISRFFVSSGVSSGSTSARFDVYRWQDGEWHMKQFTASPGDMIGLVDDKIDYQTGWTLADLNASSMSRDPVILSDMNGKLRVRSFNSDQSSSNQFKKDIAWVDPNIANRTATPGMPPAGMPYGQPPGFPR